MTLPKSMQGLNARQRKFVREYPKDSNALQAAIRAGYSPKTAKQQGSALLTHPVIRALLDKKEAKAQETALVDRAWVLAKLRENVVRAMTLEQVLDREGNPTGEYTYQGNVANKALELLGKDMGMFSTVVLKHEGEVAVSSGFDMVQEAMARKKAREAGDKAGMN